jgi:protein-arginine kinase activator protein McsA
MPNMNCDSCGKETGKLHELSLNNEDPQMVCEQCLGKAEAIGDMEYDRQREEGIS